MGDKKRNTFLFNWQSTAPIPYNQNVPLTGMTAGIMTGTNTIYSNVVNISNTDNQGLDITWTGTPTGTISVLASEGGLNFYAFTFNPILSQPAGAPGGYGISLNQVPFRYILVQYVNASGSGLLTIYLGSKDLN